MNQPILTMSELKHVLYRKIIVLTVVIFLAVNAVILVRHYFYILDSYYYNAEFHFLFITDNLRAGNTEMFTEYFRSMGNVTTVFLMLMLSHLIQNYYLPFSPQILIPAVTSAFNLPFNAILNYISLLLIGLISFGIGMFFLGDIYPFLKKLRINPPKRNARFTGILFAMFFAVPIIPISVITIFSALLRVPLVRISKLMALGLAMRLLWLFTLAEIFQ